MSITIGQGITSNYPNLNNNSTKINPENNLANGKEDATKVDSNQGEDNVVIENISASYQRVRDPLEAEALLASG